MQRQVSPASPKLLNESLPLILGGADKKLSERLTEGKLTDTPHRFRPAGGGFGTRNSSGCILDQLIDASVHAQCARAWYWMKPNQLPPDHIWERTITYLLSYPTSSPSTAIEISAVSCSVSLLTVGKTPLH